MKLLGVLLLRSLADALAAALGAAAREPGARLGRVLRVRRLPVADVHLGPRGEHVRHAPLRAVRHLLLPRPAAHRDVRRRAAGRPRRRPLVLGRGRVGPLQLHRARPRPRGRADRRPQRLRLPAGVRAAARLLPARPRRSAARWLWPSAARCWWRATLATLSRGALVGLAALAPWAIFTRRIPLTRRAARLRRGAQRGRRRVRAVGAGAPGPARAEEPGRRPERRVAPGAVDRRGAEAADGSHHRCRPGALRARRVRVGAQQPASRWRTPWSTTPTCTCWPSSGSSGWSASSASSCRRGDCSRAGAEEPT